MIEGGFFSVLRQMTPKKNIITPSLIIKKEKNVIIIFLLKILPKRHFNYIPNAVKREINEVENT